MKEREFAKKREQGKRRKKIKTEGKGRTEWRSLTTRLLSPVSLAPARLPGSRSLLQERLGTHLWTYWLLFNKTETVCPHDNWSLLLFRSKGCHSCFPGNRSSHGNCPTTWTTITGILLCHPGLCTRLSLLQDSTPNGTSHRVLRTISPEVLACNDTHPQ